MVGPPLTPSHLYEAALWSSNGQIELWAELLGNVAPPKDGDLPLHGIWIHKAAAQVQRRWRAYRRWREQVDVADVLGAFSLEMRRRGLPALRPVFLLPKGVLMDPILLQLGVVFAACVPSQRQQLAAQPKLAEAAGAEYWHQTEQVFRWLEACVANFCVSQASEFIIGLDGLAEFPRCLGALQELIQALLSRLAVAFPWFLEHAVVDEAGRIAAAAAQGAAARSASQAAGGPCHPPSRQLFVAQVHSEILSWVLESAEEAIHGLECTFENGRLAARIEEMPCFPAVLRLFSVLEVPNRTWLVRLEATEEGPLLLMPVEPGKHFGGVLRAGCAFFGFDHAELFTSRGGHEPLQVEATPESLQARGVLLRLTVHRFVPEADSFEVALYEIAKSLGTRFQVDREARVIRLPRPEPDGLAKVAQKAKEKLPAAVAAFGRSRCHASQLCRRGAVLPLL